jgi:hypothetical protein
MLSVFWSKAFDSAMTSQGDNAFGEFIIQLVAMPRMMATKAIDEINLFDIWFLTSYTS